MKERPIIFSGFEVRATRDGRKTQFRRVMNRQINASRVTYGCIGGQGFGFIFGNEVVNCPYGQPGDRLWLKETFRIWQDEDSLFNAPIRGNLCHLDMRIRLRNRTEYREGSLDSESTGWRPSIRMPKWLSRITLKITGVRAERLHDISESDAIAEGISMDAEAMAASMSTHPASLAYSALWESINGPGSWAANQWVWVIEFQPIKN